MGVKRKRIDGVDLSHWQGDIDINWGAAKKAGVKFLFHKATEGAAWTDNDYDRRRKQAKDNGVVFGAYHFARPAVGDARAEADHFIDVARPRSGDLKPCLDLEDRGGLSDEQLAEWVQTFTHQVYRRLGFTGLILYTPFDLPRLPRGVRLWVARYNDQNEPPRVPRPFKTWAIHQFSNGEFGVPNSVPGIGHVDLNTLHRRFPWARLNPLRIPQTVEEWPRSPKDEEPEVETKDAARLKFAHISMQFSDNRAQQRHDADAVFRRGYDIITGTESGAKDSGVARALRAAAEKHGYRLHDPGRFDTWVAVKRSIIVGDWETGQDFALWRSSRAPGDPPGRWGDKAVVWASWDMGPTYGRFAVGSVHYLTHGGAGDWKNPSDKKYAEVVDEWTSDHGKGRRLAFIGGDFNLNDRRRDVFFGHPLTTCWDDLKKFPNTGHGPIDAIARYDRDGRVRCVRARAFTDNALPLHTDHFLIEATYEVQPLPKRKRRKKEEKVPARPKRPRFYRVKSGDTLSKIAARFDLDWRTLARWNRLDNPDLIRVGQRLRLRRRKRRDRDDRGTSKAQEAAIREFRNQGHGGVGMCLKRVREAFDIGPRSPSAIHAWNSTPESHRHRTRNPNAVPRGYPVYWEGGRYGHVAISLGNGRCLSTDILRSGFVDEVSIDFLSRKWGKRLVGWADQLNGVNIND